MIKWMYNFKISWTRLISDMFPFVEVLKQRKCFFFLVNFSLKFPIHKMKIQKFIFAIQHRQATVPFGGTNCCAFFPENCYPLWTKGALDSSISPRFHSANMKFKSVPTVVF